MRSSPSCVATSPMRVASARSYGAYWKSGYDGTVTSWYVTRSAKTFRRDGIAYVMKCTSWPRRASSWPSSVATTPEPPNVG